MLKPRRIGRRACEAKFSGQQRHGAELTKSKINNIETTETSCFSRGLLIALMLIEINTIVSPT
jgi:hypothetical protein